MRGVAVRRGKIALPFLGADNDHRRAAILSDGLRTYRPSMAHFLEALPNSGSVILPPGEVGS